MLKGIYYGMGNKRIWIDNYDNSLRFTFIMGISLQISRELPSGDDVKASEISDVKAFNCANGFIWAFFTLPQLIAAILFPINTVNANFAANIFQVGGVLVGIPAAIIAYKQIEKKYRNKGKAEQK